MKKNSGVRIQESEVRIKTLVRVACRRQDSLSASLRYAKSERYQPGIQTGTGIIAPPNFQFGGGAKTPII
ncbi:hypothetical protein [Nostoc sp. KVJ20]|uniref:hypothetical protein n=1 Tax=Nostoc sp. KVJ20 TaxID=457944 RepID=UPI00114CED97|nr:hypothetical protein [Nostoc sp. KVJ20]